VDSNQAEIVEALRGIDGVSVLSLAPIGKGCPDIAVGWRGFNFFFEIKNPERSPSDNPGPEARQQAFRDKWHGQVQRVTSLKEIITAMTGWNP
jgi:hypothetical protein